MIFSALNIYAVIMIVSNIYDRFQVIVTMQSPAY